MNRKSGWSAWIASLLAIATAFECRAKPVQLESLLEIDCSAYHWQDGAWIILRLNAITRNGVIARILIPTDNPETAKLSDGTSLRQRLDFFCARFKN